MNDWVKFGLAVVVVPPLFAAFAAYVVWAFITTFQFIGWVSGL